MNAVDDSNFFSSSSDEEVDREYNMEKNSSRKTSNSNASSPQTNPNDNEPSIRVEATSLQLYNLHYKLINVSLRLAQHHLQSYWSSSAMQALRTSARRLSDALHLLSLSSSTEKIQRSMEDTRTQYAHLWEYCGHFARSFASDELWREQGHTCGDDVISLLRDVDSAGKDLQCDWILDHGPIGRKIGGQVNFSHLSILVCGGEEDAFYSCKERAEAEEVLNSLSVIQRDKWRVLVASVLCYSRAIGTFTALKKEEEPAEENNFDQQKQNSSSVTESSVTTFKEQQQSPYKTKKQFSSAATTTKEEESILLSTLRKRLGDACNEIGKILLSTVKTLLNSTTDNKSLTYGPFIAGAEFWFEEGLSHFEQCHDLRNIALLRCNLCQCCKINANAYVAASSSVMIGGAAKGKQKNASLDAESCLQQAADHLQIAHSVLNQHDTDPKTWDMVSEELAATYLVLGVRRRQSLLGGGTTPVVIQAALWMNKGKERSIVQPMEQALRIYESLGNRHQAAAVHYQLALFYAKVWTCQRDEKMTREKLSAAFMHFSAAHRYFFSSMQGNEPTFVILSLDLSNLYSAVSGAECLSKALACCLDTADAFSPRAIAAGTASLTTKQQQPHSIQRVPRYSTDSTTSENEWLGKMTTLAENVEDRVFKLLLNLVKIEKEENDKSSSSTKDKYKEMYRIGLTMKMMSKKNETVEEGGCVYTKHFPVYELLVKLKEYNRQR